MNKSEIPAVRLNSQQLAAPRLTSPEETVAHFGAMQAQDYAMAKWAIGVRLPGSTGAQIEAAVAEGRILRSHLLRPTWHFVAARDIRALVELSRPQLRATSAATFRGYGLDAATLTRSNDLIAKMLEGGRHLTRAEIMAGLKTAGIESDPQRASYLMFNAEIDAVVCSGAPRGGRQTYALLDERVPPAPAGQRDAALGELTKRYFTSHAPATLKDFVWWSGLPTADARKGLEMNKNILESCELDGHTYFLPKDAAAPVDRRRSLFLLPAFDEFMVSYKDRTASLDHEKTKQAITGNGIFRPIVVVDGKVAGVWRKILKKDALALEKTLFCELSARETADFHVKAREYALFEGKNLRES